MLKKNTRISLNEFLLLCRFEMGPYTQVTMLIFNKRSILADGTLFFSQQKQHLASNNSLYIWNMKHKRNSCQKICKENAYHLFNPTFSLFWYHNKEPILQSSRVGNLEILTWRERNLYSFWLKKMRFNSYST